MIARLRRWWGRRFLLLELTLAAALASFFLTWTWLFDQADLVAQVLPESKRQMLYSTLATLSGSLLGFVIASITIILTQSESPRLALLKSSKHYVTLWKVFTSTIRALAFGTAIALTALLLDHGIKPSIWMTASVLFALALMALRLVRVVWVLENVVRLLVSPKDSVTSTAPLPPG